MSTVNRSSITHISHDSSGVSNYLLAAYVGMTFNVELLITMMIFWYISNISKLDLNKSLLGISIIISLFRQQAQGYYLIKVKKVGYVILDFKIK